MILKFTLQILNKNFINLLNSRSLLPGFFLTLGLFLVSTSVGAVTVHTEAGTPQLEGKPVTLELFRVSMGVEETDNSVGQSVETEIGESVDLGPINSTGGEPMQLRVDLPDGSFYHSIRPQQLQQNKIELTVHPLGPTRGLTVEEHSVLVQPFPRRMMVREIVVFQNPTQHRVGGPENPVKISLPEGATRFNPGPGFGPQTDYQLDDGTLRYRVSLAPGRTIIGFFYMVTTEEDPYRMQREVVHPTRRFILNTMIGDSVTVKASGLQEIESASGGPARSRQYIAENLSAGDQFSMTWSGLQEMELPSMGTPGPPGNGSPNAPDQATKTGDEQPRPNSFSSVSWPVFLGIGISFLMFAGAYGYVQFSVRQQGEGDLTFLVEEIARLDQEYEDGAIEKPYYRRTRRRWKNKARELDENSQPDPARTSAEESPEA